MTNDPKSDRPSDPERDAWLSQALRHAPDAQAAPPAALSDAILRQARAATAAARAPQPSPVRGRWRAAWEALARPSVAAGFASVLVATVVGMLWWDRPMDSTIARAPAADASPPAAAPMPVPPQADAPIIAAAPKPDAAATSASPERADAAAMQKGTARPPAPRRDALAAAKDSASVSAPPPVAAPAAAAEPDSPSPVPFASRAREPDAQAPAERRAETLRNESRAPGGTSTMAPGMAARPAAPLQSNLLPQPRAATPSALLASIGAQPERWAWERGGLLQPITPALRRWLAQLEAAVATAPVLAGADAGSVGEAAVLRLYRDGALSATLRLDDVSVGLVPGPRTVLSPDVLSALKQGLADATR